MFLSLVKNGVPWHEARNLSPQHMLAYFVIFGEMEGGEFDWARLTWKERN